MNTRIQRNATITNCGKVKKTNQELRQKLRRLHLNRELRDEQLHEGGPKA